jgi:hypothetical protein
MKFHILLSISIRTSSQKLQTSWFSAAVCGIGGVAVTCRNPCTSGLEQHFQDTYTLYLDSVYQILAQLNLICRIIPGRTSRLFCQSVPSGYTHSGP